MKNKSILLFAFLILLSIQTKAQLGLHIGYNFSKVDGSSAPFIGYSEKSLSTFSAGVFYDKDLIPLLDLRLGLMYSPKGTNYENGDWYYRNRINYLEIPLQAKLKIGPFYALGGVYGAYALGGKSISHTQALGVTVDTEDDLNFDNAKLKKSDFGMKFGAGFQFGLGPVHIFAQGDYSFGFTNIHDASGDDWKNNVAGVSAGVILGF
jgi:hypothetical protein